MRLIRLGAVVLVLASYAHGWLPDKAIVTTPNNTKRTYTIQYVTRPLNISGDLIDMKDPKQNKQSQFDGLTFCEGNRSGQIMIYLYGDDYKVILLHELMHAITDCEDDKEPLHKEIYFLSERIRQLAIDNPALVKHLVKK